MGRDHPLLLEEAHQKPNKEDRAKSLGYGSHVASSKMAWPESSRVCTKMTFSIRDFRASLERDGFIKSNHSQLLFFSPQTLAQKYPSTRDVVVRCEQANIPSVWFTTDDTIRRYGYGPVDKAPHIPQFDPYTCTFIADKNGLCHRFFTDWLSSIVGFDSSKSMLFRNEHGLLAYETQYRSKYTTDVYVKVYDNNTDTILQYRLNQAWVQSIQEQPMSWQQQDDFVRLIVTFQYRDWSVMGQENPIVETQSTVLNADLPPGATFDLKPSAGIGSGSAFPAFEGTKAIFRAQDAPSDFGLI